MCSTAFNEIIPEDEIGVYSALESLGYEDVDYKFRKNLENFSNFKNQLECLFINCLIERVLIKKNFVNSIGEKKPQKKFCGLNLAPRRGIEPRTNRLTETLDA